LLDAWARMRKGGEAALYLLKLFIENETLTQNQTFIFKTEVIQSLSLDEQKNRIAMYFIHCNTDFAVVYHYILQNVGGSAKDFGHKSGNYKMELIVGDAVIENPLAWSLVCVSCNHFDFL